MHFKKIYTLAVKILESQFRRNLTIAIGGTLIAQLIPIAASFLLTRTYSPEDFGLLSNFNAALSFITVFTFLKYDLALILPKHKNTAANLFALCVAIGLFVSLVVVLICYVFYKELAELLKLNPKENFVLYLPLAGFGYSLFNLFNEWAVRQKRFGTQTAYKVVNNLSSVAVSLVLSQINSLNLGLIKGQISGNFIAVLFALRMGLKQNQKPFRVIKWKIIKALIWKYRAFSKFNIPGQIINTLSVQIIVFYLTTQFGLKVAGYYALSERILGLPASVFGNAVKDVFKQKAAEDYRRKGECVDIYRKITLVLLICVLPPLIIILTSAPRLFDFLFGSEWVVSGEYAQIMALTYSLSFVTMPTGWLFVIAEKQNLDLLWQVIYLIISLGSIGFGYLLFQEDVIHTLGVLSAGRIVAYLIQMMMTAKLAAGKI